MTSRELLDIAKRITQENIDWVRENLLHLSQEQLKWRPGVNQWNIDEVLAHLNIYGDYYHDVFRKKIENTRFTSTKEAFVSSPLGRSSWKSMKLGNAQNIKRKFKAVKGYNPMTDSGLIRGHEVERFIEQQQNLLEILELAENVNLRRIKIPISISKIVRLRLGDAILFVIYHNERHVQQVKNICGSSNYPA